MTLEEFVAGLDRWGADLGAWPQVPAQAGRELVTSSLMARREWLAAARAQELIARSAPDLGMLKERILARAAADAPDAACNAPRPRERRLYWTGGAALAASLAIGLFTGWTGGDALVAGQDQAAASSTSDSFDQFVSTTFSTDSIYGS